MQELGTPLDSTTLIALSFFALVLVGVAGTTHALLSTTQTSSVDRARFVVIGMFGMVMVVAAYLPILVARWIEDTSLVFRICTFLFFCLWLGMSRWRDSFEEIKKALDRMLRESVYPRAFTTLLRLIALVLVILNIVAWPLEANQGFYELLLIFAIIDSILYYINLVVFRIVDSTILENPINAGWEAVIYDVPDDPGKVLKLFNFYDKSAAENEVNMTKAVSEAGLPSPTIYGDVIELNDRFGFYMEKIDGSAFANQGIYSPTKAAHKLSEEFAQFHAELHAKEGIVMPLNFVDVATTSIRKAARLSEDEKQQILQVLKELPVGDRVYHGDFHPGNVMRRNDTGELVIIDWVRVMNGHPLADVARTHIMLSTAWLEFPLLYRRLLRYFLQGFVRRYTDAYLEATEFTTADFQPWVAVAAAMRLGEPHGKASVSRHLAQLVKKYLKVH